LLATSFVVTWFLCGSPTTVASSIEDRANLFSAEAVRDAQAKLDRLERKTHVPVVIEIVDSVPGLDTVSDNEKRSRINSYAVSRDREIGNQGVYLLISKGDRLISNVLIRERLARALPESQRLAIRNALTDEFKKRDFDAGLQQAVSRLERSLSEAAAAGTLPAVRERGPAGGAVPARRGAGKGGSAMSTLLMIAVGIVGVLFVIRLLGAVFGGRASTPYPPQMGGGMGGARPGYGGGFGGPGYGPGYGGRGGGFFSGMLGGLGGALAGNWLYDQFSGRHGSSHYSGSSSYVPPDEMGNAFPGGDNIIGAGDDGGMGASWDDAGGGGDWGGDVGGGDWGGGDSTDW
jgi:uncharacterized protein